MPIKAVRTDRELECPVIDAELRARGVELVTLPDGIPEAELMREVADADLVLMCYTPITARVIEAAKRLKGIVKYGVGIDAIDIPAAMRRGFSVSTHALKHSTNSSLEIDASGISTPRPLMMTRCMVWLRLYAALSMRSPCRSTQTMRPLALRQV